MATVRLYLVPVKRVAPYIVSLANIRVDAGMEPVFPQPSLEVCEGLGEFAVAIRMHPHGFDKVHSQTVIVRRGASRHGPSPRPGSARGRWTPFLLIGT